MASLSSLMKRTLPSGSKSKVHPHPLIEAARVGNLKRIKKLGKELDDGWGLSKTIGSIKDDYGGGLLHHAAAHGMTHICKYLVENLKLDVDEKDEDDCTPFLMAIGESHLNTAAFLLENGADPATIARHGTTALFVASASGCTEIVHLLLSKAVDVNVQSDFGTPLQAAAMFQSEEVIKILLDHGADPNYYVTLLPSPLSSSVAKMSLQCTKLLLQAGANPNEISCGTTPLIIAANKGETERVECLLGAGADPNVTNTMGDKAIEIAASNPDGNCEAVTILFKVTSPIPAYPNWSISGIMTHLQSEEFRQQGKLKLKEKFLNAISKAEDAFTRKDYLTANFYYAEASCLDHSDATVLSKKSLCWASLNEGEFALEEANACIRLRPDWPEAYYRKGVAWATLKKFNLAANAFSEGLRRDPEDKELQIALREAVEARMNSIQFQEE